jgi:peptidoglycan/LPS O-acetylase OafA/YrhL
MSFAIKACAISTLLAAALLCSSYFLKGQQLGEWVDAFLYILLGMFLLLLCLPQTRKLLNR